MSDSRRFRRFFDLDDVVFLLFVVFAFQLLLADHLVFVLELCGRSMAPVNAVVGILSVGPRKKLLLVV